MKNEEIEKEIEMKLDLISSLEDVIYHLKEEICSAETFGSDDLEEKKVGLYEFRFYLEYKHLGLRELLDKYSGENEEYKTLKSLYSNFEKIYYKN